MRGHVHGMVLLVLFVGCGTSHHGEDTDSMEIEAIDLPAPSVQETGGEKTDFFFRYVYGGDDRGSIFEVLLVTTNKDIGRSYAPALGPEPSPGGYREVILVNRDTAERINKLLIERGFFEARSLPHDISDSDRWSVLARTATASHQVQIDWYPPAKKQLDSAVGKLTSIVDDVRAIAKKDGHLLP